MSETKIPGLCATHRIISDDCREAKGDETVRAEVRESVNHAVARALDGWEKGKGAKIHVVVTVERPSQ